MATQIPYHPCRILINGCSRYGKKNSLLNLVNRQADIEKIYLYAKNPCKAKYQFLINKKESTGLKHFNDSNTRLIWMIFIKTMKNTTQIKYVKR